MIMSMRLPVRSPSTVSQSGLSLAARPLVAPRAALSSGLARSVRTVQAKLTIGEPDDAYEREADEVADRVARQQGAGNGRSTAGDVPAAPVVARQLLQRQETSNPPDMEEKLKKEMDLQRKGEGVPTVAPSLQGTLDARAGAGESLPGAVQNRMERSFGFSFDRVRIHADGESARLAKDLRAEAFTYGSDIYFAAGRYDHRTSHGTRLLAHELTHTLQQQGVQRKAIQRRGGPKAGDLAIRTNVVGAGLTAGHAWLSYTPVGGTETTYGTWGNKTPIGLHLNLERGYPYRASRSTPLDSGDYSSLTSFASANNDWGYINNCASFAARGWRTVTGESLSYTSALIPNPSALGEGIVSANGGATGVLPATTTPATPSSSSL
jgi:hypothetical protein